MGRAPETGAGRLASGTGARPTGSARTVAGTDAELSAGAGAELVAGAGAELSAGTGAELVAVAGAELASGTGSRGKGERSRNTEKKPQKTGLSFAQRRELEGIVAQIESIEAEAEALTRKLADPATYAEGHGAVAEVTRQLDAARARAQTLTTRWEQLEALKDA